MSLSLFEKPYGTIPVKCKVIFRQFATQGGYLGAWDKLEERLKLVLEIRHGYKNVWGCV